MNNQNGLWINENTFIPFNNKQGLFNEIATRKTSASYFSSMLGYLPDPDLILKKQGKDISVYRELLIDAKVGAVVEQRKSGVLSLEWEIDRGKSKSRESKLISEVFNDLPMENIISEILDAFWYGFQVLEVVWEKVGNYLLPKSIIGKPQEWFVFDDENRLKFKTKENPVSGEPVPGYKFLLASHKSSYMNPYGERVAAKCFWPVTFKKGGIKFWVSFAEKYGMPWVVGKQPRGQGKAAADDLLDQLENMVQDAVGVIPDDSSVEVIESGSKSGSADIFSGLKDFCNSEISLAVLTETLTTEIGKVGSYGASKTHEGAAGRLSQSDRKIVMSTFNTLVSWIYKLNFTSNERSKFVMFEEEDVDQELAERDKTLSDTGVKFTKVYFERNYNLKSDEFEIADSGNNSQTEPPVEENQKKSPEKKEKTDKKKTSDFSEFSEEKIFKDQAAIDNLTESLPDKLLQLQAEQMLKPVIDLINSSKDYSEVLENLASLYPDIKTSRLERMLQSAIFLSEYLGMSNSDDN